MGAQSTAARRGCARFWPRPPPLAPIPSSLVEDLGGKSPEAKAPCAPQNGAREARPETPWPRPRVFSGIGGERNSPCRTADHAPASGPAQASCRRASGAEPHGIEHAPCEPRAPPGSGARATRGSARARRGRAPLSADSRRAIRASSSPPSSCRSNDRASGDSAPQAGDASRRTYFRSASRWRREVATRRADRIEGRAVPQRQRTARVLRSASAQQGLAARPARVKTRSRSTVPARRTRRADWAYRKNRRNGQPRRDASDAGAAALGASSFPRRSEGERVDLGELEKVRSDGAPTSPPRREPGRAGPRGSQSRKARPRESVSSASAKRSRDRAAGRRRGAGARAGRAAPPGTPPIQQDTVPAIR